MFCDILQRRKTRLIVYLLSLRDESRAILLLDNFALDATRQSGEAEGVVRFVDRPELVLLDAADRLGRIERERCRLGILRAMKMWGRGEETATTMDSGCGVLDAIKH